MMHYRVGDGGFAQLLAKAFAAGHGATVSNGPFDYLAAGTEIHKAIEAMQDEVRTDAPGVRLKAAEHACTIYELLGAYADVITRRTGLLADPEVATWLKGMDALAFLPKKRSNRA